MSGGRRGGGRRRTRGEILSVSCGVLPFNDFKKLIFPSVGTLKQCQEASTPALNCPLQLQLTERR